MRKEAFKILRTLTKIAELIRTGKTRTRSKKDKIDIEERTMPSR